MKILLAQRLPWFPALAGETKFNRWLLEALAERNHSCRMLALAMPSEGPEAVHQLRDTLADRGMPRLHASPFADVYAWRGVEIHVVPDGYHLWTTLAEQIREFDPDCVLISQDRTYLGLATALAEAGPSRVIYLAHSQATLPFGPECFSPDEAKTDILRRTGRIVASSRYIGDYISRWSGIEATVLHFAAYGPGPFPNLGRADAGFVTLVNPSALKGVSIFEGLARARPDVAFAAVPTWATTAADLERLRHVRNVRVLPPAEQIEDVLSHTRILLVPSLWGEGFGLIVVEAMLRGIPVLASDIGGLPEAKMGIDYLLPVRAIERYQEQVDERGLPIPIVPPQNLDPWIEALDTLLADPAHYHQLSEASRGAAWSAVSGLDVAPFEEFLEAVSTEHHDGVQGGQSATGSRPDEGDGQASATANLSRDRLELLARLLEAEDR